MPLGGLKDVKLVVWGLKRVGILQFNEEMLLNCIMGSVVSSRVLIWEREIRILQPPARLYLQYINIYVHRDKYPT